MAGLPAAHLRLPTPRCSTWEFHDGSPSPTVLFHDRGAAAGRLLPLLFIGAKLKRCPGGMVAWRTVAGLFTEINLDSG